MRSKFLISLIFLVGGFSEAPAWNATGHMVIADIALARLAPRVKIECNKLLAEVPAKNANTFIDCASWADNVRTKSTAPWHYIDQYFRADGAPTKLQPEPQNVVWAIQHFSAILKNRSQSEANRAEALRFLIHFVGDIHQPLHCASRVTHDQPNGDKGGNDFYFSHPDGSSRPHELHYLWDEGGGLFTRIRRPVSANARIKIDTLAQEAIATFRSSSKSPETSDSNPMDWAKEGLRIAKTKVYSTPEFQEPSESYVKMVRTISLKRVAIAGIRLANLLNKLLSS